MVVRARFYDCLEQLFDCLILSSEICIPCALCKGPPPKKIFTLKISHSSRVHTKLAIFKLALQNRKQRRGTEPITT